MLSTALVMPEDNEELALTLNGKKRKIRKEDFIASMQASGLGDKVIENIFTSFGSHRTSGSHMWIDRSCRKR